MTARDQHNLRDLDEDAVLRVILEGTATATGEPFFSALVQHLCEALNTQGAWVTEYLEEAQRLRALAFWMGGTWVDEYEYDIAGTPCEPVIAQACLAHFPENVIKLFPSDPDLKPFGAVSYMGVPLLDLDGTILGHLAVLDTKPMPAEPRLLALFRIFADRAAAELRRLRAEAEIREHEQQLDGLVSSALDAIIQVDEDLRVVLVNPAAEKTFRFAAGEMVGQHFGQFLAPEDHDKLTTLARTLSAAPKGERQLWIPGGLKALRKGGDLFAAEATLACFDVRRTTCYMLVLRDVNERLESERKIRSLTAETEYLQEEIRALHNFEEIIGESPALLRVLRDVQQVADTDATVLIVGETGTGKELIARAIHRASRRRAKPLIAVNCAAIPSALIESEFFGHEKGAFTGATARREGRFALAHGGTIFLDEVGELPVDLQAKLLRVLQEGEFAPVGSSRTRTVDVRVIAATNRDLTKAVKEGTFREDLYYRLNVFPIEVPALRERGGDVVLLASAFAQKFAQRMGRSIEPPSADCTRRLRTYDWPGNVRELQNVIERAVITSHDGRLNLDRALPESTSARAKQKEVAPQADGRIRTVQELRELERRNILLALETTGGRVSGDQGAARLLEMNPSTLYSRIKALGLDRL